jgi:hypothetical protein
VVKIKTLVESLMPGYEKAFDNLDKKMESLGDVKIDDIRDNIYPMGSALGVNQNAYIQRIVVYKQKAKKQEVDAKCKAYKPTLDTDLMDFAEALNDPKVVPVLRDLYGTYKDPETLKETEHKTIRDLVPMSYLAFTTHFNTTKDKMAKYELLDKTLRQYGFKLLNK